MLSFGGRLREVAQEAAGCVGQDLACREVAPQQGLLARSMGGEQFVIERGQRLAGSRISLATGPPKQLAIDAGRFVVLRQDHVQSSHRPHFRTEDDVGSSSRHVGGYGDPTALAGVPDDLCFRQILPGIQHDVFQAGGIESRRYQFRSLDRAGAWQLCHGVTTQVGWHA